MIPLDLHAAHQGRSKVTKSLQTGNQAEAKTKAKPLQVEWDATFAQKRRELNSQRIESVTPQLSKVLAARVSVALLRNGDLIRGDLEAQLFLGALRPFRASKPLKSPRRAGMEQEWKKLPRA